MKTMRQFGGLVVRVVVTLSLVLGTVSSGGAQEKNVPKKPATPALKPLPAAQNSEAATAEKPSGGPQEGIKVHGHWVIIVRDPDGSEVGRREFENGLVTGSGDAALSGLLGRNSTIGFWLVQIDGACSGPCLIGEPTAGLARNTSNFSNLTVDQSTSGPNANGIVLTGTAKSLSGGTITNVVTKFASCPSTVSMSTCNSGAVMAGAVPGATLSTFTQRTLAAPISVQPAQSIDVTVVISFS